MYDTRIPDCGTGTFLRSRDPIGTRLPKDEGLPKAVQIRLESFDVRRLDPADQIPVGGGRRAAGQVKFRLQPGQHLPEPGKEADRIAYAAQITRIKDSRALQLAGQYGNRGARPTPSVFYATVRRPVDGLFLIRPLLHAIGLSAAALQAARLSLEASA